MTALVTQKKVLTPVVAGSMASYGFAGLIVGAAFFGMIADLRHYSRKRAQHVHGLIQGSLWWHDGHRIYGV